MKNQPYNNFWQRLHKAAKEKNFPLRVMFELTYRCNFSCKHCYVPLSYQKRKELKTKEIFLILDQLADIGCFYLGFTGGEPFVRKDAMEIFRYAKKKGFEVIIYSNGSLINENIAQELAQLRPNKVDITIPGMSEGVFDTITGSRGSREKVFKAIEFLRKNGVALGFKTCVLKENEKEIGQIQKFAQSLGALHRIDDMLSRRLDGSDEPYKFRGKLKNERASGIRFQVSGEAKIDDCTPLLKNRKLETKNIEPRAQNLFKCGVGETQAAITPQGNLKPCLMIDSPQYTIGDSLEKAWEKLKRFIASIKPDEKYHCLRCELQPYCKWCPARSWLYNKNFTSCESESRAKAELLKCFK